jgi:hypothetical protein
MVDCASYPNITQLYFTDNWNLSVCALFQLLLEQTKPWKSSLKFNTKFRTEKYDLRPTQRIFHGKNGPNSPDLGKKSLQMPRFL